MAYKNMTYEEYIKEFRKVCFEDALVKTNPKAFEKVFRENEDIKKKDYKKGLSPACHTMGFILMVEPE